MRGCEKKGIEAQLLNHNRDECIGCGWCNYGCRYNRKTSMLVTLIPWAEELGAVVLDQCHNVRLVQSRGTISSVEYHRDGKHHSVAAERVVVCAGGIGSSEVLLKSGIDGKGRVGKNFHALGGVIVAAEVDEQLDGYDGIGLTAVAKASDDYVIETFFAPPGAFSVTLGGWFGTHYERMRHYKHYVQAGVMVGTEPRGIISVEKKGTVKIDLRFSDEEVQKLKEGLMLLSEIFFEAGATLVLPGTFRHIELTHPKDLDMLDQLIQRPDDLLLGSAHPQGGNVMCEDPAKGVVNQSFCVHGFDNLYVADSSVFPSNIWANCQATVMALAHIAADYVGS